MDSNGIQKPVGLSDLGEKAYKIITDLLIEREMTYTGGCRSFYSPREWKERGEQYGLDSQLIIVYDGGDLRPCFCMNEGFYQSYSNMQAALFKIGCYFEECTGWYAAVYQI